MHDVVWMTVRRLNKQGETVDITRAPGYVAHSQPDQFLSPHEAMPSHEQAQIAAASGPSWMPPPRNVLDPQYVNNATMQLRGTLAHASQLPPTSPPAGSWPSDDEARAWAMEQAARVRANWASAAASAHAQPRPPHVVSAPVAPQPASFNPPAPPRVAQKARRTDERGLEAFDFNA
jgi:hypothetical protein